MLGLQRNEPVERGVGQVLSFPQSLLQHDVAV
jgi:hypothetical protein